MNDKIYYAGIIVIGNEILSGKTQDKNINFLANELQQIGIRLQEVRIVPDVQDMIIEAVQTLSKRYDYVFTTGGIGPTHDDITAAAIAKAFSRKLILDPRAVKCLEQQYTPEQRTEARMKMAHLPEGAELINNPVSLAPGFIIENVYVMAGVPRIAAAMFSEIKSSLKGGKPLRNINIHTWLTEGVFATYLTAIQERYPDVEIGSYPFMHQLRFGTTLVIRGIDDQINRQVEQEIKKMIADLKGEIIEVQMSELS